MGLFLESEKVLKSSIFCNINNLYCIFEAAIQDSLTAEYLSQNFKLSISFRTTKDICDSSSSDILRFAEVQSIIKLKCTVVRDNAKDALLVNDHIG